MSLDSATSHIDPPFAALELEGFDANLADLLRRAAGKPGRPASKPVRCRALMERRLRGGVRGIVAFTPPGAVRPAGLGYGDTVVGYPTVDRAALARLPQPRITVMVDCA